MLNFNIISDSYDTGKEISQKGMVVIRIIAITWLIAQSNKSSYLEGRREGYRYYPGVKIFW
jgi:hypothetical protein